MRRRVLVVGSSNTDMIVRVSQLPRPGETRLGGHFMTAAGGKGANQAVAAARAGGQVAFIARVGKDALGAEAIKSLKRDKVDVRNVRRDPREPSGVALITVAHDGENNIAVASGANSQLSRRDIAAASSKFREARVLLTQLETPLDTVAAAIDAAHKLGAIVILNPAPAQKLPASLLKKVSILTPNETEAEMLSGVRVRSIASARNAARILRHRGAAIVIVTLGARGAFVSSKELETLVPGFAVRAVDTTAAGDVFNGALAVALAEGQVLREAVRFANAAAALSVMRFGAQPSAPRRRDIQRLLRRAL